YDDGEKETGKEASMVRLLGGATVALSPSRGGRLEEGAEIEGNYRGRGKLYAGKISRDNRDGTFDVDYHDGEKEIDVAARDVHRIGASVAHSPQKSPGRGGAYSRFHTID
ncbi:hypothetical protein B484DRAFT_460160, partial [Ochromonadaceae sp. CCMP2298]